MFNIGIITIIDYDNYGNRLQNYAVQEILISLGHDVETIVNIPSYQPSSSVFLNKLRKIKKMKTKRIIRVIENKLKNLKYRKIYAARNLAFRNFTKELIKETPYVLYRDVVPKKELEKYDFFVVGSDQIWNPHYRQGTGVDFLVFAPESKRVAYVPSFGVSQIPSEYEDNYRNWISGIPHLSVREQAGAEIIKSLTGRDVPVFIDPTLMLPKEKWLSIEKKMDRASNRRYILTYFLGEKPETFTEKVLRIAQDNQLDIINLSSLKDTDFYCVSPSEFIGLINSATLLCTDSYHGVIFSILMQTPFIIFDRSGDGPSMNSRIDTLLKLFKLEHRHSTNVFSEEKIFEMDYSHVDAILEKERSRAYAFLKNALGQS